MLEGLDAINWANLTHAYGSAGDVPDQLRDLMSDDPQVRYDAWGALESNIYHQGSIYDATDYAVPFLVELLQVVPNTDKVQYLDFLRWIATGNSWLDVHQQTWTFSEEERASPEHQQQLRKELQWVQNTKEAIYRFHPLYIDLLKSGHPEVRACAACLLGCFPEYYDTLSPYLFQHLIHESNTMVRSSLLLSLSQFAPAHHDPTVSEITPYLHADLPLLTQWAAAIALVRLQGKEVSETALNFLVKVLQSSTDVQYLKENSKEIPAMNMDILSTTCMTLCYIGRERLEPYIPILLNTIPAISFIVMERVAYALVWLVFNGQPMPEGSTARDLDEVQYQTLKAIAENAQWKWKNDRDPRVFASLSSLNVPCVRKKLIAFLEKRKKKWFFF